MAAAKINIKERLQHSVHELRANLPDCSRHTPSKVQAQSDAIIAMELALRRIEALEDACADTLSIEDQFAMAAMQGMQAHGCEMNGVAQDDIACCAYDQAAHMMRERQRRKVK